MLKRVKEMGDKVSQLTTIWADGGFDGPDFMMWVMDICRCPSAGGAATETNQGLCLAQKSWVVERTYEKVYGVSPIGQQTMNFCHKHRRRFFTLP
ncbi:MAG: hypothetical protein PUP93_25895 [Rhizonema sp. NSF051]|nr:hypothetical protein [Rhizonema sp. NSF051]